MGEIKAKETYYKGYRFRSRLEARWAVLFDALGIEYEYEPEGYKLPDGTCYLPDFVLHGGSVRCPDPLYVEVKGVATIEDHKKIKWFTGRCPYWKEASNWDCSDCQYFRSQMHQDHKGYDYYCECGIDIDLVEIEGHSIYEIRPFRWRPILDTPVMPLYLVTNIPENIEDICNGKDVEGDGFSTYYYNFETVDGDYFGAVLGAKKGGGWGLFGADSNYWVDMDVEKTQAAYNLARQARFEHGETPVIPK